MKHSLSHILTLLAVLSLVFGSAASSAQLAMPDDPRPDRRPLPAARAASEPPGDPERPAGLHPQRSPSRLPAAGTAAAFSLGQPGTSFRHTGQIGITEEGYPASTSHLNLPNGLFIDAASNVYVTEGEGSRVLRFNSAGANTLSLGKAGMTLYGQRDYFAWPEDLVVDASGDLWIVDEHRVVRFSSSGDFEMSFPAEDDGPGQCVYGTNDQFCVPTGIAFDASGRLYVAEYENHRVQVFTLSGGVPQYLDTIGSGSPGATNADFNYPTKIAIDGLGNLYVTDSENFRVQKCQTSAPWTCVTFHGLTGTPGMQDDRLDLVTGVAVDAANNVYIADTGNWRVKKCTPAGSCFTLIPDVTDPQDVAVDTLGNVYVSENYNTYRVGKYNSAGVLQGTFAGTFGAPFVPDTTRINTPFGIGLDPGGNLYVSEANSNRWLKYNPQGVQVWARGEAGIRINDGSHFGDSLIGNPAAGPDGLLYLPSGNARCVRIFDQNGGYLYATIGICHGQTGDSGTLLGNVTAVAVNPLNGWIYVADRGYDKIKIYNDTRYFQGVLGGWTIHGTGDGDYQFRRPAGLAFDASGNLYVADRNNHRVQKYNSGGVYQATIGITGVCGWEYDTLCAPSALAVDRAGRVYVAESWNDRVQVFDSNLAYLTTIGGSWGSRAGELRNPSGVAVAYDGTVYVTEMNNQRISIFTPGYPFWSQANLNGFGDRNNGNVHTLESFNDTLFAGTYNDSGGQLWSKATGSPWQLQTTGFGDTNNAGINDLVEFEAQLYAGVRNNAGTGGKIFRSSDGLAWGAPVVGDGFGASSNFGIYRLQEFEDQLYASTGNNSLGAQIWRSPSGDSGDWTQVVDGGYESDDNTIFRTSAVHGGALFFASQNVDNATNTTTGGIIIRSESGDGGSWSNVSGSGFGDANNFAVSGLASFNGYLYAATTRWNWSGIEVWRCQVCDSPDDWEQVVDNGFGNPDNWGYGILHEYHGQLYLAIGNEETGTQVWRTASGDDGDWQRVAEGGFGDRANLAPYYNAAATHNGSLYFASQNDATAAEIWTYQEQQIFLPLIVR